MTFWTDHIATGFFYASVLFALAWTTRAVWRLGWRRDDQQAANLAAGIADERRLSLLEPDPTPFEDEVVVDPPVTRMYVEPGWTVFRGRLVHEACLVVWLRGGMLTDGCKVHLTDDVQAGAV